MPKHEFSSHNTNNQHLISLHTTKPHNKSFPKWKKPTETKKYLPDFQGIPFFPAYFSDLCFFTGEFRIITTSTTTNTTAKAIRT